MDDGADMALEDVMDDEDARLDYRRGDMSDIEAYNRGIIDELGYEITGIGPKPITCRCCGVSGLHWSESKSGKWRLFDDNGIHNCKANPLKKEAI
jgi:hypothetical protein